MTEEHAGRHYQPKLLAVPGPGDLVKVASRTTLQTRRTQRIGCGKGKLNPRAGHACLQPAKKEFTGTKNLGTLSLVVGNMAEWEQSAPACLRACH